MWKEPKEGKEVRMRKRKVSRIPISEGLATNSSWLPKAFRLSGVTTSLAPLTKSWTPAVMLVRALDVPELEVVVRKVERATRLMMEMLIFAIVHPAE